MEAGQARIYSLTIILRTIFMTRQFPDAAPASTVILIRKAENRFEVYLLKRGASAGFMAGKYVFPGGMVDETDKNAQDWLPHVDMEIPRIKKYLAGEGLAAQETIPYAVAAIRETFEEAGALLARGANSEEDILAGVDRYRQKQGLVRGWFRSLVKEKKWQLEFSSLYRWAHWVTPREMKRHYDTLFFLAAMPAEQTCSPDGMEMSNGVWLQPLKALEENIKGSISLSPPTLVTLHQLSKYRDHKELQTEISDRLWGPALRPRVISLEKGAVIVEPWDPEYHQESIHIDQISLKNKLLVAGVDFSRIWLHNGFWRSVGL